MNRNSLTGLLTALAVIPLYFKGPARPAPEKWDVGTVSLYKDMDRGEMRVHAPGIFATAKRDPLTDKWKLSCHPAIANENGDVGDGDTTNIWQARAFITTSRSAAMEWMRQGGWQPFAVIPLADPSLELSPQVYFRRRVQ